MALKSILIKAVILSTFAVYGMAYNCPSGYPFPSCPREGDDSSKTVCCFTINDDHERDYHCCDEMVWAIALIVVGCIIFIATIVCICACCCGFCACLADCCRPASRRVYCKQTYYQAV